MRKCSDAKLRGRLIILYYVNYLILHHIIFYSFILYNIVSLKQGITGVPAGSVINEDTSPGPVQTYLLGFGGAPGRI